MFRSIHLYLSIYLSIYLFIYHVPVFLVVLGYLHCHLSVSFYLSIYLSIYHGAGKGAREVEGGAGGVAGRQEAGVERERRTILSALAQLSSGNAAGAGAAGTKELVGASMARGRRKSLGVAQA